MSPSKGDLRNQRDFGKIFQKLEDLDRKLDHQTVELDKKLEHQNIELRVIKEQVLKTNGRVTVVENRVENHELQMRTRTQIKQENRKETEYKQTNILFWFSVINFILMVLALLIAQSGLLKKLVGGE